MAGGQVEMERSSRTAATSIVFGLWIVLDAHRRGRWSSQGALVSPKLVLYPAYLRTSTIAVAPAVSRPINFLGQDNDHVSVLRATDLPTFYLIHQLHRFFGSWSPCHIQPDETPNGRREESHNRLAGHHHETVRRSQH